MQQVRIKVLESFSGNITGMVGDILTIPEFQAKSLLKAGVVEICTPEKKLNDYEKAIFELEDRGIEYDKRIKSATKLRQKYGLS